MRRCPPTNRISIPAAFLDPRGLQDWRPSFQLDSTPNSKCSATPAFVQTDFPLLPSQDDSATCISHCSIHSARSNDLRFGGSWWKPTIIGRAGHGRPSWSVFSTRLSPPTSALAWSPCPWLLPSSSSHLPWLLPPLGPPSSSSSHLGCFGTCPAGTRLSPGRPSSLLALG